MFRAQIFSISGIFHLNWGDNQSITEFYHTVKDDDTFFCGPFCCWRGSALPAGTPERVHKVQFLLLANGSKDFAQALRPSGGFLWSEKKGGNL